MKRILVLALALLSCSAMAADSKKPAAPTLPKLSAAQVVEKNVAARGGLSAWRAVNTLTLSGSLEAGGKQNPTLPFTMKLKREHKTRLEIEFQKQMALQVYNGKQGWKLRPFLNRDDVEPYTPDEAKQAAATEELDGLLVDYAAKGTSITLAGTEKVDEHAAYVLKLKLKNGDERKVWVAGDTFLELKVDGQPRKMDGRWHDVNVYYRDYLTEQGVKLPKVLETVVEGLRKGQGPISSHKMTIEHAALNLPMDDAIFEKPVATAPQVAAPAAKKPQ